MDFLLLNSHYRFVDTRHTFSLSGFVLLFPSSAFARLLNAVVREESIKCYRAHLLMTLKQRRNIRDKWNAKFWNKINIMKRLQDFMDAKMIIIIFARTIRQLAVVDRLGFVWPIAVPVETNFIRARHAPRLHPYGTAYHRAISYWWMRTIYAEERRE